MSRPTTTFPTQTIPDGTTSYVFRPLTTVFVPPDNCPDLISEDFDTTSRSCAPDDWSPAGLNYLGYYSPGICPQGYTVGCNAWDEPRRGSMESRFGTPSLSDYYPEEGTTAALCVPANFRCWDDDVWTAISVKGTTTEYERAIQIRWQDDDLIYLETHPMSPGVTPWTSTSSSSVGPTPTETDTDGNGGEDDGGGLSGGAIAGIVVGSLAVILAFGGVAFFMWWRKRKAAQAAVAPTVAPVSQIPPTSPGIAEMPAGMHPAAMQNQQHLSMYGGSVYDPSLSPAMTGGAFPNGQDPRYSHMSGYSPQPQTLTPQSIPAQNLAPGMYGASPPQHPSPDMHSSQTSTPQPIAGVYPVGTPPIQQHSAAAPVEMDASQPAPAPPVELASEPMPRDNQHIPDYVSRQQ